MKNVDEFFAAFGGDFFLQKRMELENVVPLGRGFLMKNLRNPKSGWREKMKKCDDSKISERYAGGKTPKRTSP